LKFRDRIQMRGRVREGERDMGDMGDRYTDRDRGKTDAKH
jgi:hypothetical protein